MMFSYCFTSSLICLLLHCQGCLGNPEKLIDLSHPFNEKTLHFRPDADPFRLEIVHNGTITKSGMNATEDYWYQTDKYSGPTHAGTHMDAPCHFAKGKWSIADIPIQRLVTRAVVVDIETKSNTTREAALLSVTDLELWERQHGRIPDGSVLLVKTGGDRYWPDRKKVFGNDGNDTSQYSFPGIDSKTAQWLVKDRKIYGVGIDTPSLDHGPTVDYKTHRILNNENIYGLENLANLGKLPATGITVYVLPMKISGASGAPCRVLASLDPNIGISNTPTFLITLACLIIVIIAYHATLQR